MKESPPIPRATSRGIDDDARLLHSLEDWLDPWRVRDRRWHKSLNIFAHPNC